MKDSHLATVNTIVTTCMNDTVSGSCVITRYILLFQGTCVKLYYILLFQGTSVMSCYILLLQGTWVTSCCILLFQGTRVTSCCTLLFHGTSIVSCCILLFQGTYITCCILLFQGTYITSCCILLFQGTFKLSCFGHSTVNGFVLWFDVGFPQNITLTTSPYERYAQFFKSISNSSFTPTMNFALISDQWRIQKFRERALTPEVGGGGRRCCANLLFGNIFAEKCMKMNQFGPNVPSVSLMDPPLVMFFVGTNYPLNSGHTFDHKKNSNLNWYFGGGGGRGVVMVIWRFWWFCCTCYFRETHWQQCVVYVTNPFNVKQDTQISGSICLTPSSKCSR